MKKKGGGEGLRKLRGVFLESRGFRGEIGFPGVYGGKSRFLWENRGFIENRGFCGKIGVLLKNEVFVGFWSRIPGKVGKSREFDDFWKIEKIREK